MDLAVYLHKRFHEVFKARIMDEPVVDLTDLLLTTYYLLLTTYYLLLTTYYLLLTSYAQFIDWGSRVRV